MFRIMLFAMILTGTISAAAAAEAASGTLAGSPKILGVSHVALKVGDLAKSRAFYKDFLGFGEGGELIGKDGALKLVFIKVNDEQYFELFPGLKPEEDRLYQVAFQVTGIEALRARLAAAGIKVPASVPKGQVGNSNFTIKDPDDHNIELVQYEPAGWTRRDQGKFMPEGRISTRIRHAGFLVGDAEASMKFYGGLFGMNETWRGSANGQTISWICMKFPDGTDYVELMLGRSDLAMNARGTVNHLSLDVPDIEKAKAALEHSPYWAAYNRRVEIKTGKNLRRQLNLFDPDGTRVELMEPTTVDGAPAPSATAPLPTAAK